MAAIEIDAHRITQILTEVLQDASFVLIDATARPPAWQEPVMQAILGFSAADGDGRLLLATTKACARVMAENMCAGELDGAQQADDALGEVLNIVTGVLTAELFGPKGCSFGLPKISHSDVSTHEALLQQAACSVTVVADETHRIAFAAII